MDVTSADTFAWKIRHGRTIKKVLAEEGVIGAKMSQGRQTYSPTVLAKLPRVGYVKLLVCDRFVPAPLVDMWTAKPDNYLVVMMGTYSLEVLGPRELLYLKERRGTLPGKRTQTDYYRAQFPWDLFTLRELCRPLR